MGYRIIVSPKAQKEIEEAIDFYLTRSIRAPVHFIESLQKSYILLSKTPHFSICYKNVRSLKLTRFPVSLYFVINEETKIVKILSCFHNKLNPLKLPDEK